MKKAMLAVAAAAVIAAGTVTAPNTAQANCRSCGPIIVGVLGGIVAAGIIGSLAQPRGYAAYESYERPRSRHCRGGYYARQRLYSRHGEVVGWSKPRLICP